MKVREAQNTLRLASLRRGARGEWGRSDARSRSALAGPTCQAQQLRDCTKKALLWNSVAYEEAPEDGVMWQGVYHGAKEWYAPCSDVYNADGCGVTDVLVSGSVAADALSAQTYLGVVLSAAGAGALLLLVVLGCACAPLRQRLVLCCGLSRKAPASKPLERSNGSPF